MTEEQKTEAAAPPVRNLGGLRAFAIVFGGLNVMAAAAAIFGAIVYVGEANDRQLQRDTFEALAVEMLFARLDRARETRSNASDVLHRLNGYGVRMRDIDLTNLVFIEPPTRFDREVYLHGENYFIACPVRDDSVIHVDGSGRVANCAVSKLAVDLRNPVQFELAASNLTEATFYCRRDSSLWFTFGSYLEKPTFHCRREQVWFRDANEPVDARWCHPDDDPAERLENGAPVYASGPCAGEFRPDVDPQPAPAAPTQADSN